ncbi:MAG: glucose 1-dehydrogenase [Verrucomicrobia bacterium]|nr:glucose 1-dehydrogenase [Verrucomicrobiota bacterium]
MDLKLQGKVALVTGASKGIGKGIAGALAAEGANVVISARGQAALKTTAAELNAPGGGQVAHVFADVTKAEDCVRLVEETVRCFGKLHVLVNNAAAIDNFGSYDELSDDNWQALFELNVLSVVRMTRAALPHMRREKWGRIINIASENGLQPDPFMPHYSATKAAILNMTKSMSKAFATDGILVNSVSPAFILTSMSSEVIRQRAKEAGISFEEAEKHLLAELRPHIELKRTGRIEEVGSAVAYLASESASFITGTNLRVDGGSVASS